MKRFWSILTALILLFSCIPLTANAATSYMQTVKANVPIWTEPTSDSVKSYPYPYAGTVLRIVSYQYNSKGKLWCKLDTGKWVYHENVTSHKHSYVGGICTGYNCGYEWPYTITPASGTYVITNPNGGNIWSRPYSNNSTKVYTYGYGTAFTVNAITHNEEQHDWYRLTNGFWVYSENVRQRFSVFFHANGGNGGPETQYVLKGNSITLSSVIPKRVGYTFKGWSTSSWFGIVTHRPGGTYSFSEDKTLYAVWSACSHDYVGGICSKCNYEYPLSPSAFYGTFVVTKPDGAKVWNRPYSNNATTMYRAAYGTELSVVKKVVNEDGKIWYQLSNGYWIFSDNTAQRFTVTYNANGGKNAPGTQYVLKGNKLKISGSKPTRTGYNFKGWTTSSGSKTVLYKAGSSHTFTASKTLYAVWSACSHDYVGGICSKCNYEYPLSPSAFYGTFVVTKPDGAKVWNRPYSNNATTMYRAAYGTELSVVKKVVNEDGKIWYQLSNGYWIFSDNTAQRFTVTYNANGGKNAPGTQYVLKGNKLKISGSKPTRTGYNFNGWSTSSGSEVVSYKAGKSYTISGNKKLYAVWSVCPHTYNAAGKCTKCAKEKPYKITTTVKKAYRLSSSNGTVSILNKPFSGATKMLTITSGDMVKVNGYTTIDGKKWYRLDNQGWVSASYATLCGTYSGNKLSYSDSSAASLVTTVSAIPTDRTSAVNYLKKHVGTIDRYGLVPGLNKTVTRSNSSATVQSCTNMVPQGITFSDDYLFISAYCACGKKHRSVIYVLDNATRTYQTTLILDNTSHVGGLAILGNYLWVCDTGVEKDNIKKMHAYAYSDIQNAVTLGAGYWSLNAVNKEEIENNNNVTNTPSYVCSANGYLYIGAFSKKNTITKIGVYKATGKTLEKVSTITISGIKKIQGISIRGNTMILTSSHGRTNNSKVYVFNDKYGFTSDKTYYKKNAKVYTFANMLEGCYIGNSYTYFVFESGAKEYRNSLLTRPLDWYIGFKNSKFGIS